MKRFAKLAVAGLVVFAGVAGWTVEIKLPPETAVFKQDAGADLANGQCLVCHSVEYVTTQPPMPRTFWKAEVVKMQQKYGAQFPDAQVEPLTDYLTRNYGVGTNGTMVSSATPSQPVPSGANAVQLATRYGCFGCHNPTMKIVGPPYRDIATKYRNDPAAFQKIDQQIHQGGSGKWGPIIMPPFPSISAEETRTLANWILATK